MADDFQKLGSRWPIATLGEDVRIQGRIGWKGYKTTDLRDSGPLVIGGANIKSRPYIDRSESKHLSRDKFEESPEVKLKEGDVLLVTRGNLADAAYVDATIGEATINPSVIILSDFKGDPKYLFYYLISPEGRENVLSLSSGSSVPAIYQAHVKKLKYPKPPLAEQKAIAVVLGALDDKIELNRRMNATLEAMARALFQSWFVDFDPVRAKQEGRTPAGLDEPAAALFPAQFQNSELGEVPQGWEVVSLEAMASIRGGKQLPTEDCLPVGEFTVFGANGIMGYATHTTHSGFVIAFGRVGAYCGSIHWSLDGAWINNNASSVVPLQWPEYVLQSMLSIDFHPMRTGSAQPFIPNSSLASVKVVCPSPSVAELFCRIAGPLRRQQADNEKQSRTLAALRDTLLPKLLSGELKCTGNEGADTQT